MKSCLKMMNISGSMWHSFAKMSNLNGFGQELGKPRPNWKPRHPPEPVTLYGQSCRLEPLNENHADDLYAAYSIADARLWTYTYDEPLNSIDEFRRSIHQVMNGEDLDFVIIDSKIGKAVGQFALKRADPINGVVEVAKAKFSPLLRESIAATEAQYLLMEYVFDQLGYRRYEANCNSNNEPAHKSLTRVGFTFEGVMRNIQVAKGHSLDLKFFSIIDDDWPQVKEALNVWMAPENFDKQGRQIRKLEAIRETIEKKIHG